MALTPHQPVRMPPRSTAIALMSGFIPRRLPRRPILKLILIMLAAPLLGMLALAGDLAAAAAIYGPAYVWRLIFWRAPNPDDGHRFPSRGFGASIRPTSFSTATGQDGSVRVAFAPVLSGSETLEAFLSRTFSTSLLVLRNNQLVYQGYFNGSRRDTEVGSFSMAKSITSLLVGIALAEGKLPALDTPAARVLPNVPGLKNGVTIRQIMDMTSGFALDHARPLGPLSAPWTDYKLMYFSPNLRAVARSVRPIYRPGTHFSYDDRNPMLVGLMLEQQLGEHVTSFLQRRLWDPVGAEWPGSWSLDSESSGFEKMESGINARPLDFLKIGALVLNGGLNLRNERIIPPSWIEAISTPTPRTDNFQGGPDEFYTLFWWGFTRANEPPDIYAHGIFGQVLLVSRARNVVILRTGSSEGGISWPRLLKSVVDRL